MYSGLPIYFFLAIGFSAQLAITQNVCDIKAPPNNFEHATCNKHQARCVEEKGNLLERLSRSKGTWEARHPRYRLLDALHGFLKYSELVSKDVDRWRTMYKNVPKHQRKMLERTIQYSKKLNENDHLLAENKKVCEDVVRHAMQYYGIDQEELEKHIQTVEKQGRVPDKISIGQALKHLIRDWSVEGDAEHDDAFPCIVTTLLKCSDANRTTPVKVLLPGSGLGRLGHDIHDLGGYEVTLNEYSAPMNTAYRYLTSLSPNTAALHPFIDTWSNHATTSAMQRHVVFPSHIPSPNVVLIEGDFTTIFKGQDNSFDVIITLFFIDTARNLLSYFDTIHRLLKPGGTWINFGPLLYGSGPFVQLSLDEIVKVVDEWGFEFLQGDESCGALTFPGRTVREKTASYAFNGEDLSMNAYRAQSWVARKAK